MDLNQLNELTPLGYLSRSFFNLHLTSEVITLRMIRTQEKTWINSSKNACCYIE